MADQSVLVGPGVHLDPGVSFDTAIEWLQKRKVEGETLINTRDVILAHPFDAALALKKAFLQIYGFLPLDTDNRPNMAQIPNGVGTHVEVPWGKYLIPNTDMKGAKQSGPFGWFAAKETSGSLVFNPENRAGRMILAVTGKIKMAQREKVRDIITLAQRLVKEESIYKGKILKVNFSADPNDLFGTMPEFISVTGVTDEDLILPADVNNLVATALWTPIEYPEQVKAAGVPTKRGILLEGPPGTGKTLTLNLAAQKAQASGATVLYIESVEQLSLAISFMQDYGRGVVIAEDVERVMGEGSVSYSGRSSEVNNLLNALDGIQAKGTEVMVILTTNYVEVLDKALLRPGRFDAVVPVRAPDQPTVERLMKHFGRGLIDPAANLSEAAAKLNGQIPAVIREVVERAKLAQIRRTKGRGGDGLLVAGDLKVAADGMMHHLSLLAPKAEVKEPSGFELGARVIAEAMREGQTVKLTSHVNGDARKQKEAGYAGPIQRA